MNTIAILPYQLIRYASGHHSLFAMMRCPGVDQYLLEKERLEQLQKEKREAICDALHAVIAQVTDESVRSVLVQLRRDVFNGRKLREHQLIHLLLFDNIKQLLDEYQQLQHELLQLSTGWNTKYESALHQSRLYSQQLGADPLLLKGIRLSSKSLFDQLAELQQKAPSNYTGKDKKIEFGLMRYLTRMYFKTSPFSTFTHIGIAVPGQQVSSFQLPQQEKEVLSKARINNHVYQYVRSVLINHPEVNDYLYLRVNPTADISNDNIHFLINLHNIESFQQMPATAVTRLLLEVIQSNPHPFRLGELVTLLTQEYMDGNESAVKAWLLEFFDIGLLEWDLETSALHPDWDILLCRFLGNLPVVHPLVTDIVNRLQQIRTLTIQYGSAEMNERNDILEQMVGIINAPGPATTADALNNKEETVEPIVDTLQKVAFTKKSAVSRKFTTENILYEDAYTREFCTYNADVLQNLAEKMTALCWHLSPLDSMIEERKRMYSFFRQFYTANETPGLFRFYHDYYKEYKLPLLKKQEADPAFMDEHQKTHRDNYRNWMQQLQEIIAPTISPDETIVYITDEALNKITNREHLPTIRSTGYGMFAQCFQEVSAGTINTCAVVNEIFQGMGKTSGRFLHLFEPRYAQELKQWNETATESAMAIELTDSSFFNANIHPPLLNLELRMPDGQNSLPAAQQIAIKDIMVRIDEHQSVLWLQHLPTGRKIVPFDLSLQAFRFRSQLYQMLTYFSWDQSVSFLPIQATVDSIYQKHFSVETSDVVCYPRIVYEQQLVLKRKSWVIRTKTVPVKASEESDADYFARMHQWRMQWKIPEQVFLFIARRTGAKENASKAGSDEYKPQYIHFENPLLVLLWSRLLTKADEFIQLEEMYPDTSMLGDNPVHELLIQWYNNHE